jgi:hypothetical protein
MSWVAVETVGDEAAAAILVELLAAHAIPTQIKRLPGMPYGPAKLEIEVRVPEERLADARALVAQLAEEAEAAAVREADLAVPPREPAPRRRTLRLSLSPQLRHNLLLLGVAFTAALLVLLIVRSWTSPCR